MKLNLGCGYDKREGFINLDSFKSCEPDILHDIEDTPWPFDDDSFNEILIKHVLEHIGETFNIFRNVMREIYRVSQDKASIHIHVPNYKHVSYWADPTHVRAFDEVTFIMMSKKNNDRWIKNKSNYTMLAYLMDVNFELISSKYIPSKEALEMSKSIKKENKGKYILDKNINEWNVIREMQFILKVIK
tara:strand:- start:29 stop:592 length:564 start_codon:yes stop_codon:yes gene_type:complete